MKHYKTLVLASALTALFAGCAEKKAGEAIAVKVNGTAIGVAELEGKLKQYSHFPAEQKKSVADTLLKATVDAELLRQAALAEKLDQEETVRLKLLQSNRMILANAYVEKRRSEVAKPGAAEIKGYYDKHPELFAGRKIYELTELAIVPKPANEAEIVAKLGDGKQFEAFEQWLTQSKIPHGSRPHTAAPDGMPEEIAVKLSKLSPGQAIPISNQDQLSILRVNAAQAQPIALEQATPAIEKKLSEEAISKAMETAIKSLRDKAKLEYNAPYSAPDAAPAKP
jgi:EpsD family peptidyl-prolyl cis-trans isomerase